MSTPEILANGQPGETEHSSALLEIDELSRQLVAATTDRILAKPSIAPPHRAIRRWSSPPIRACRPRAPTSPLRFLQQIHARRSDLEQEQAQLSAEHGPSFPRVVEIGRQLQDLDRQKQAEDAKLVERFRSNWQTALDREQLVRKSLEQATGEGMKLNEAATEYAVMRQEANASHDLYMRVLGKGRRSRPGRRRARLQYLGRGLCPPAGQAGCARSAALPCHHVFRRALDRSWSRALARVARIAESVRCRGADRVARGRRIGSTRKRPRPAPRACPRASPAFPQTQETKKPAQSQGSARRSGTMHGAPPATPASTVRDAQSSAPMPAPIGPGDFLDISEYHTPEFHSTVRVSAAGTVTLPMIGEVKLAGMDEQAAARAIEAALLAKGMLLHPLVSVLVTAYAGQDVSVLGEVTRPGVYPYTVHHRLLDLHLRRLGPFAQCRPPGECLSSGRSQDAAPGGARPQRNRHRLRPQSRAQPRRHRSGEPRRPGLRGGRCDPPRRISRSIPCRGSPWCRRSRWPGGRRKTPPSARLCSSASKRAAAP